MNKPAFLLIVISTLVMGTGCGGEKGKDPAQSGKQSDAKIEPKSEVAAFTISPGADAQQKAQEAFILAKEGDVIEFAEGKFEFDGTLSISGAKGIKVKGQGINKTILNFANQTTGKGAEGLHIRGDDLVLEDLTVEDSPVMRLNFRTAIASPFNALRHGGAADPIRRMVPMVYTPFCAKTS